MGPEESGESDATPHDVDPRGIGTLEHELTMHLERAHELAARAKRANSAVRDDIERARELADEMHERVAVAKRR